MSTILMVDIYRSIVITFYTMSTILTVSAHFAKYEI